MIADFIAWGKACITTAKRVGPHLVVPGIIVLVGISAFGLGRLSALQEGKSGLVIYPAPVEHANQP